jgi:hypothetical protein
MLPRPELTYWRQLRRRSPRQSAVEKKQKRSWRLPELPSRELVSLVQGTSPNQYWRQALAFGSAEYSKSQS